MSSFETRIDNYVREELKKYKLDYYEQRDIPENYKEALKTASKTGSGQGIPDFLIHFSELHGVCVVIEDKYGREYLDDLTKKGEISESKKSISDYAVNGAIHYAKALLDSGLFTQVYALGIAGDGEVGSLNIVSKCYLVRKGINEKFVEVKSLEYFTSENVRKNHKENQLTEEEKHLILEKSLVDLGKKSKSLNVLMNDNAITVANRIVYVSGCLLAMENGLRSTGLEGNINGSRTDGKIIYNHIKDFLEKRDIPEAKRNMMLSLYNILQVDVDNDKPRLSRSKKSEAYGSTLSVNKDIFTFIEKNIYETIQDNSHIDSMGQLYSEFLKYAVGDGKDNGIVLTPPTCTRLMNDLIEVNKDSRVVDLCLGSAGFLVSSMAKMLEDAREHAKTEEEYNEKAKSIKGSQLLGSELDLKMYVLASANMILRGDGSSNIYKGDTFELVKTEEFKNFGATHALLNPPFSYTENGMPFALEALNLLVPGGKLAIIIQDSAGTGKAIRTNKDILAKHSLLASIRMPGDLFIPSAGVQTSIYIFEAQKPHDYKKKVRFIDFSNDGYKRTGRGIRSVDNPDQKYRDVLKVYKYGEEIEGIDFIDDVITDSGADWNYTQHRVIDTIPVEEDFMKTIGDYLTFEISRILEGESYENDGV